MDNDVYCRVLCSNCKFCVNVISPNGVPNENIFYTTIITSGTSLVYITLNVSLCHQAMILLVLYIWECKRSTQPMTNNSESEVTYEQLPNENEADNNVFTHTRGKPRLRSLSEESYVYVTEGTPLLA